MAKVKGKKSERAEVPSSEPITQPSAQPPEQAHDDREVAVRGIVRVAVVVAAMTAVVMALAWWGVQELVDGARSGDEPLPIAQGAGEEPPDPKLQPRPAEGLAALRQKESRNLDTYGWVDKDKKLARIPVERAIAITAERAAENSRPGLTWRKEAPSEPSSSRPTDASLGVAPSDSRGDSPPSSSPLGGRP